MSQFNRNIRKIVSGIFAVAVLFGAEVQAQSCPGGVCPPVVVTAPTGSGNVICRGSACAGILEQMQANAWSDMEFDQQEPIAPEDVPIDRAQFCRNLKDSKPSGCGSSPPPVPGVNTTASAYANAYGNGCGDGSWSATIANAIGSAMLTGYTGNPDSPLLGVNFRNACNAHDACYAGQGVKGTCDANFYNNLMGVCSGTGTVASACGDYAAAYRAAVGFGGQSAYLAAYSQQQCALWHKNMDTNQCPR